MKKTDLKISDGEYKFMSVVWDEAPCKSKVLVEKCAKLYKWTKSTTYTQLHRMIEQGLVQKSDSVVAPMVSKEQVQIFDSGNIVKTRFQGSLPAFVAAFVEKEKLSEDEINALKKTIENM